MANHRYIQFWPQDWVGDAALSTCSLEAKGLWIDLICLAHGCEPYGHLTVNGGPMPVEYIAKTARISPKTARKILNELKDRGVFSLTDDGIIYCRRMVRDADKSERNQRNGRLGGNPALKPPDKPKGGGGLSESDKPPDKPGLKANSESESEKGIPHKGVYPFPEKRARELSADAPLVASLPSEEPTVDSEAARTALAGLVTSLVGRPRYEIQPPQLTPEEQIALLRKAMP